MQRNTSLFHRFAAGHLGTAYTSGNLDLDTFGAHTHRRCDSGFHGAAERYAALQLAGDVLSHDHGVNLRTLHFEDIDLDLLTGEFLQLLLEFIDLLAALADDDTRTGGRNRNRHQFQRALDDDLRDACLGQTDIQVFADLGVLDELVGEILATEPVGIPTADDTKTICYRIYFLSHLITSFLRLPFCQLRSSRDSSACGCGVRDPAEQPEYASACDRHRRRSP